MKLIHITINHRVFTKKASPQKGPWLQIFFNS